MNTLLRIVAGLLLILQLSGCATAPVAPATHSAFEPSEPPKDGKILVLIYGNARERGQVWLQEDANLKTVEDSFSVRSELASHTVSISRQDQQREKKFEYRLDTMSDSKKKKVKVYHGDSICFIWDGCFGFAPDQTPQPGNALGSATQFTIADLSALDNIRK